MSSAISPPPLMAFFSHLPSVKALTAPRGSFSWGCTGCGGTRSFDCYFGGSAARHWAGAPRLAHETKQARAKLTAQDSPYPRAEKNNLFVYAFNGACRNTPLRFLLCWQRYKNKWKGSNGVVILQNFTKTFNIVEAFPCWGTSLVTWRLGMQLLEVLLPFGEWQLLHTHTFGVPWEQGGSWRGTRAMHGWGFNYMCGRLKPQPISL